MNFHPGFEEATVNSASTSKSIREAFYCMEMRFSCHPIGIPEILISYWFLLMILNRGDRGGHWWDPGNQFRRLITVPNQLLKERDGGGNARAFFSIWGDPEGTVFHYLQW